MIEITNVTAFLVMMGVILFANLAQGIADHLRGVEDPADVRVKMWVYLIAFSVAMAAVAR